MSTIPNDLPGRILDGSPDTVLVSDRVGAVRYWNAGAERIFGFSATETLGRSMDLIIPERLRARHWAGWEKVMETGDGDRKQSHARMVRISGLLPDFCRISEFYCAVSFEDVLQHLGAGSSIFLHCSASLRLPGSLI